MIKMREVLVRPGIVDSARVCALSPAAQLFFRNVMHCCDGKGRFPADAAELRAALYWRCPGVSIPHLEAWLQKCSDARLVKIYTKDGNRYGEVVNFGQRDSSRKAHYPGPPGQEELELATADPPRRAPNLNRIEGKGKAATPAPKIESDADWHARLRTEFPHLDLDWELAQAAKRQNKAGKKLDRRWFERHWLANIGEPVNFATATNGTAAHLEPEPEAWGVWLEDRYPGNVYAKGGSHEGTPWAELPASVRAKIAGEMGA